MARIAEEKILQIRERVDIVEVVSRYLQLKRSGVNHQGLCPFHSEKTPSFNVNSARQIFHCFGCGVGGNVFNFLMRMEGLAFPEAVRRLGEQVGIEIEEETLTPEEEARRQELEQLRRINEVACEFYHQLLLQGPEAGVARAYLKRRGYDGETARQFRLGFAPDRWDALTRHLAEKGIDSETARKLGLIRPGKQERGDYDLFRGRLLFPIFDSYGAVAAFGGRVLDDSLPKYINSPESPIYHKGRTLYGLYQAKNGIRQAGETVVVEGYFDLIALHQAGVVQSVATCGTALTGEHARLLKRYGQRVVLLFDQDQAGRQATFRAMEALLPEGLAVATVSLDAGEDPDSFLQRQGVERFRERLAAARPVFELFIEDVLTRAGESIEGRARAVDEILGRLRLIPGDIERRLYVKDLARRTGLDEEMLVRKAVGQVGKSPVPTPTAPRPRPTVARPPGAALRAQDLLLQLMVSEENVRSRVAEEGPEHLLEDDDRRSIAKALCGRSMQEDPAGLLDGDLLNDEQKALLSGILMRDRQVVAEDPERIFSDCRTSVGSAGLKQRSKQLLQRIQEAEKAGDYSLRDQLNQEFVQLSRELRKKR